VIIGLIRIFKERFNAGCPAARFLSEQAFGVYVFHAPVLVAISTAVKGVLLHPLPKFSFVSVLAVAASFTVSRALRKVGFLRMVFS
jgi:surface polysaccharide O-acyltransferase-like enzyme